MGSSLRLYATRLVPAIATLAVIWLTVSLGNWQLRRAAEKIELQRVAELSHNAPAVPIGTDPADPAALENHHISARGVWLSERSIFLDNRTHDGQAGFYVLTPLQLLGAGGPAAIHLLVLRGWIARDPVDRSRLPTLHDSSAPVEVDGLAERQIANSLQLGSAVEEGRIWQAVTLDRFAAWSGLKLQPLVLRQDSQAADGLIRAWPQPGNDVARHRAYAVQWYGMALAAAAMWIYYALVRKRK